MRENVEFSPGKIHESVEGRENDFSRESFPFSLLCFLQKGKFLQIRNNLAASNFPISFTNSTLNLLRVKKLKKLKNKVKNLQTFPLKI
jgi:hypothetical protein